MKRSPMRHKRREPRTRSAPRWSPAEWEAMDRLLQARARGRCDCCGLPLLGRCERHHRQRRRDGGDRLANLLVLRPECHWYWTGEPEEARRRGIIVSAFDPDPALVLVLLHGHRWLLLGDGGELTEPIA